MTRASIVTTALVLAAATTGAHAISLDGTIDAAYGPALAVQTVETGFGDTDGVNFGSELNAAYATVSGGTLFLGLTGNLEPSFNKLNIFIDSKAGGENVLTASIDGGGSNPNNDGNRANQLAGLTFDAGFTADYQIILRGNGGTFDADFVTLGDGTNTFENFGGIFGASFTGSNATALPINNIGIAFDNSNVAGVGGGNGATANTAAALAVTTGFELAIPLSAIGNPLALIRITAAIGNGDQNFFSNQLLAGLPDGTSNLGGDNAGNFTGNSAGVNFAAFAGDQFFTVVVPEPASLGLLAAGGAMLFGRRRAR